MRKNKEAQVFASLFVALFEWTEKRECLFDVLSSPSEVQVTKNATP